jgi:hypothetical protein
MDKVSKSLRMAIFIKGTIIKESRKVSGSTTGAMGATSKETSREELETGMEFGKNNRENLTNTKASTSMTRNQATAFLLGLRATFIKGITFKIRETVMVRCTGKTGVSTRENGERVFNMVSGRF